VRARIESADNPRVKDAVRLRDRRARGRTGRFLVEGARELGRALDAGHLPETLFVEESLAVGAACDVAARAEAAGARVLAVSGAVYRKIAVRAEAEGVVGVLPVPDARLERLALPDAPLIAAAIGVEKPGNVGALLRSADAFGADALVVEGGTDLWNPNVVRASLGCLFTVPVAAAPDGRLVPWLAERGVRIAAATPDGDTAPADADLTGPVALLLGSEETGLPAAAAAAAHVRLRIPMRGAADSLNVSVAAGVLLYEADRQRRRRP
jgi:TrmH family RNA methyltransferase